MTDFLIKCGDRTLLNYIGDCFLIWHLRAIDKHLEATERKSSSESWTKGINKICVELILLTQARNKRRIKIKEGIRETNADPNIQEIEENNDNLRKHTPLCCQQSPGYQYCYNENISELSNDRDARKSID